MAQQGHVLRPAAAVLGRVAAVASGLANRLRHYGGGVDDDAIGDVQVADDIRCAADHAVFAYARAAGDAGAAGNRSMRAYAYVVSDLDQVVQLDPVFDH